MLTDFAPAYRFWGITLALLLAIGQAGTVDAQPIGREIQANSTTENDQQLPDAAMDAEGNFVVVFQNHLPVTNANVSAQRFNADGVPLGNEFLVNSTEFSGTTLPAVAMDPDGDFVVAWQDFGDDGSGNGIFAQRYNAAGVAQGMQISVNTTTEGGQHRCDVDMDDAGNFVVVWEDVDVGQGQRGIRAQRYNAAGAPQGGEMTISVDGSVDHTYPQVALDSVGNFVVAWARGNVGANQDGVFRLFDANGNALSDVIPIDANSKVDHASGVENSLVVDADADGNFVVAWDAETLASAQFGIRARRYDSAGNPLGEPFVVDEDNPSSGPDIAVAANGHFAIGYAAPDGSIMGPRVRHYHADGQPIGGPLLHNTSTALVQDRPAIAINNSGRGVIAWRDSEDLDGDRDSVQARLLRTDAAALADLPDVNSSGVREVAALRENHSIRFGRVQVKETDGTPVKGIRYFSALDPFALLQLNDMNNSGDPELGVVSLRLSDRRTFVEIRDSQTGQTVNLIFFSPGSTGRLAAVMSDRNGNGFQEIVVVQTRNTDGRISAQVRDASSKQILSNIWFPLNRWPLGVVIVPDVSGNGVEEIALLTQRQSDLRLNIQIRDGSTGALITDIYHSPGFKAFGFLLAGDSNNNNDPEVATLLQREDRAVGVRLHDVTSGATAKLSWYKAGANDADKGFYLAAQTGFAVFADNNANGVAELGVLMQRASDQRNLIQLRDASTGGITGNIWLLPEFAGQVLAPMVDRSGNGFEEAAVLGFTLNRASQARIHDTDTGIKVSDISYPLP